MNPDEKREYQRLWWKAHPGYKRAYYRANRDRLLEQDRVRWRALPPERRQSLKRKWRLADRARNYAATRARENLYQTTHPEVMREIKRRYKMRKRGATGGHHTTKEWREKCELFANLCVYCGEAKRLERDHAVPLSRGGTDLIANILPACRMCNLRKSGRTAREYLALR